MDRIEAVNTIAPALRALAADGSALKLVRFDMSATDGAVVVAMPDSDDPADIIETLGRALDSAQDAPAVVVDDVGTFAIEDHPCSAGRVGGKVAMVTGAAQGFGLEIAQSLAAEGACVVLVDLNDEGARAGAEDICKAFGPVRAIGLSVNVTDRHSIAACMHQVVCAYGGLDIFVSNAGVLRAGSVKDQSIQDFDFVTAVNYKGYFLCVQNVAPVLAVQHAAKPDYTSDIIQINSKSGLEGSNRNGAYAGSKFGGIGLTQSFALELIEDGVKVNSICPGNFFDGPLWSDPDRGLFVQYLNTGKVPGAKTIDDVRAFYEAKVPMNRGCTTPDVMQAVYYLVAQQYETGQAVPVTGGQVMLK